MKLTPGLAFLITSVFLSEMGCASIISYGLNLDGLLATLAGLLCFLIGFPTLLHETEWNRGEEEPQLAW